METVEATTREEIGQALGRIPSGIFVMTSHFEARSTGVVVSWVQQVAFEPPMVMVALRKGRNLIPMLQDSHSFALCQLTKDDRLALRRFASGATPDDDPFQGVETMRGVTGSPILSKSLAYMECEIVRHVDIDADHDLYIGSIVAGKVLNPGEVVVHLRDNGFSY